MRFVSEAVAFCRTQVSAGTNDPITRSLGKVS